MHICSASTIIELGVIPIMKKSTMNHSTIRRSLRNVTITLSPIMLRKRYWIACGALINSACIDTLYTLDSYASQVVQTHNPINHSRD